MKKQELSWEEDDLQADSGSKLNEIKEKIKEQVIGIVKERQIDVTLSGAKEEIKDITQKMLEKEMSEKKLRISKQQKNTMISQVVNDMLGYGPLEELLERDDITEIMVNNAHEVYIEKDGKIQESDIRFNNNDHVKHIIQRIVAPLGRRIDESSPMVDARLPDGSRVNAVIEPVALDGPSITIRKFSKEKLTGEDLKKYGSINQDMLDFIYACVKSKKNILISGGTGSGKTTFLNITSNFIDTSERIVTIEDSAELQLSHRGSGNLVRMESKPPNIEGKGEISIHDLVKNSLRMRPDRIIVGEVRGGEAIEMLQAMNTGHEGSLSTIHANNPREALTRLETMVMMAGYELKSPVIRENIGSALHVVVQLNRFSDGTRKTTAIEEIVDYDKSKDKFKTIPLFKFNQTGMNQDGKIIGEYIPTGRKPTFFEEMKKQGIDISLDIFKNN